MISLLRSAPCRDQVPGAFQPRPRHSLYTTLEVQLTGGKDIGLSGITMTWDESRVQSLLNCGILPSEPQLQHRLGILQKWGLVPGSKVLEIGCGQGDCTLVLADLVGEHGHVTAIDPAPLDYGSF